MSKKLMSDARIKNILSKLRQPILTDLIQQTDSMSAILGALVGVTLHCKSEEYPFLREYIAEQLVNLCFEPGTDNELLVLVYQLFSADGNTLPFWKSIESKVVKIIVSDNRIQTAFEVVKARNKYKDWGMLDFIFRDVDTFERAMREGVGPTSPTTEYKILSQMLLILELVPIYMDEFDTTTNLGREIPPAAVTYHEEDGIISDITVWRNAYTAFDFTQKANLQEHGVRNESLTLDQYRPNVWVTDTDESCDAPNACYVLRFDITDAYSY